MPSSEQTWAHSTVSKKLLSDALNDASITAIEVDILMGHEKQNDVSVDENMQHNAEMKPIMAHPPDRYSDLTTREFLKRTSTIQKGEVNRILKKHIKLDFKEIATVKPTLDIIDELGIYGTSQTRKTNVKGKSRETTSLIEKEQKDISRYIFLNADILAGPAMRSEDPTVDGDLFLSACLDRKGKMAARVIDHQVSQNVLYFCHSTTLTFL